MKNYSLTVIVILMMINSSHGQVHNSNNQTLPNQPIPFLFQQQISDVVRTIFQDSKGNIWFGTQNGAFKLTGKTLIHIDGIKCELGKGVTIKDITEDKDGNIWFGHTDGISSIDGDNVTNYYESHGLISNDVWCIAADRNGKIWAGTIEGACVFDGKNFVKFDLPEGIKDTTLGVSSKKMVHDIFEDGIGTLWFCSNAGLFSYKNNTLKHVSKTAGIPTNFVGKLIEDKNGGFLISTSVGLFHLKEDYLTNISAKYFEKSKGTGSLIVDSKANIWFNCTRSIYKLNGDKISEYRIAEGNQSPVTFQIYEDKQERLWFVGFGGAYRLENEKFVNITQAGPW